MFVERFFLSCVIATALAAGGCAAGASNSQDPPIEPVDASGGAASGKKSPDVYWVKLETTKGDVDIEVHRDWSPHGADRFYQLVEEGFYNHNRIFRVIPGFVAQVGIAANPSTTAKWKSKNIPDDHLPAGDPNLQSNKRGYVSFAKTQAANSRTTQFFINGHPQNRTDGIFQDVGGPFERELVLVDFKPMKDSKIGELVARMDIVLGRTPEGGPHEERAVSTNRP